ncbi:MAG: potassium transporter TrkH [Candidatus Electrothrix sp. ATG1]|nr:potassium transporter TrkH [Candidatus Electrothrix sp. ATG1]MCI5210067.1 potassium transporter TrkH [Candidatus Electrothrix sp. ATG2]
MRSFFAPISLPVFFFLGAILVGTALLHSSFSCQGDVISWLDALFTATSAVCVTGLIVVDTGQEFTRTGQSIILLLIQMGGLGIMTFTSLTFFLWKKRVSMTDRIAVGQSLLHDSGFHLGRFLVQIVTVTLVIELAGALFLFFADPEGFSPFSALFHAISAFCNAGFSLHSESLMGYKGDWLVNLTIIILIILGGAGFAVIVEGKEIIRARLSSPKQRMHKSWHFNVVLQTSLFLIIAGWIYIYCAEFLGGKSEVSCAEAIITSLFQSVTCRTAGFNSLDLATMTNASLVFMIFLMFVGGAPGSCAGGTKVTTFRILAAFIRAQIAGRDQTVIGKYAVDRESVNKSLTLLFFSLALIFLCVIALDFTEGGNVPHTQARGQFLEILFETVSAFGTAGLSTGLTGELSSPGKVIIMLLMFVGRLGPLVLLSSIQSMRTKILFSQPEVKLSVG